MAVDVCWHKDYIALNPGRAASGNDILEALNLIYKDERYTPFLSQFWDFSKTEEFTVKSSDLLTFNGLTPGPSPLNHISCMIIVNPNTVVHYRIQAIISFCHAQLMNSKIFYSPEEAKRWFNQFLSQRSDK